MDQVALVQTLALVPFLPILATIVGLLDPEIVGIRAWFAMVLGWAFFLLPMFAVLSEPRPGRTWTLALLALVALAALMLFFNPGMMVLVAISSGQPALAAWLVARRSARAVGPALFLAVAGGTASAVTGIVLGFSAFAAANSGTGVLAFIVLAGGGIALGAVVAGAVLIVLSRSYQRHDLGDNEIKAMGWAGAFFVFFAIVQSPGLGNFTAIVLLCVPAYWLLVRMGYRVLPPPATNPRRMLFLRTFRAGGEARSVLRAVEGPWRVVGPVDVVAAPDVAADTLEIDELETLLRGRTLELFRTADVGDTHPDPDSRYRVIEHFCAADAWTDVVARLIEDATVILFDLRGLQSSNRGAAIEVGLILDTAPAERVVWIIDANTDRIYLQSVVSERWKRLAEHSPNRTASRIPLTDVIEVSAPDALLLRVADAAFCHAAG